MHRRWLKYKEKMQTDTHQPRNALVRGRATGLTRKKSYGCRFGSSCRKLTVVFEREKRNAQEMDILPRNRANGHSPAKTWQT